MKKMIKPFLFGLMLAVSSAAVFADSSPVSGSNLSSVLGSYSGSDVQLYKKVGGDVQATDAQCASICTGQPHFPDCMKRCKL